MTSILDKTRSFHLYTNKRSTALDNLNSEPSSLWRQNAHSVTPRTHFNFYNSISIIISILNPLLRSGSLSHESSFPFTPFFTHHKVLKPLYCSISFGFFITITSIFVPFADEPLWLILVILGVFEFLNDQFLHRPFLLIFSLPLTHLFCHSLTNPTLSLFSFKTCSSTGFVLAMSWCSRSCWLLVMFSQNIHSVSLSYVQSYWILGQKNLSNNL